MLRSNRAPWLHDGTPSWCHRPVPKAYSSGVWGKSRVELGCETGTTLAQNFGVDFWAHFLPSFSVPVGLAGDGLEE